MGMNNETSGKPVLMKHKLTPGGGTEPNTSKPGSGAASGTTKYDLNNPDTYYRVSGGPTLGDPNGGPDRPASTHLGSPLKKITVPNMAPNNSARN